jgi:hypothetical protein
MMYLVVEAEVDAAVVVDVGVEEEDVVDVVEAVVLVVATVEEDLSPSPPMERQ